jgi:hypothetical protein
VGSDVLDYLRIGHEHIDMNEWRREKYYGENENEKKKMKKEKKFTHK